MFPCLFGDTKKFVKSHLPDFNCFVSQGALIASAFLLRVFVFTSSWSHGVAMTQKHLISWLGRFPLLFMITNSNANSARGEAWVHKFLGHISPSSLVWRNTCMVFEVWLTGWPVPGSFLSCPLSSYSLSLDTNSLSSNPNLLLPYSWTLSHSDWICFQNLSRFLRKWFLVASSGSH